MDTQTTASAGAAPVAPVTQVATQPATAPAPAVVSPAPVAPVVPVAPATPAITKSSDITQASGDDLAARYGLAALEIPAEGEGETTEGAPVTEAASAETPAAVVPATDVLANPITPFEFYDEQGALEIPANVKLSFKAGGQEYKDLRLDEVVRMAQQAPMAAKHQQELNTLKPIAEQAQQATQAYQQVLNELQQNNALYEQLLSNPQLYQEAASQYAAQNSPEQRLARLQEQQTAERKQYQQEVQQTQLQQTIAAAANYTATRIAPSVDALTTQYPQVEAGDVMAKFHELTAPLLAASPNGGVWVPPNRLQELEQTVIPALQAWTAARAQKTVATTQAATSKANAQLRQTRLNAQLATRQLARPLTPVGSKPGADVPKPPPIRTAGDAVEASLAKARAQIQGAA